jgi:uncharacterized protein (DUF58 family)
MSAPVHAWRVTGEGWAALGLLGAVAALGALQGGAGGAALVGALAGAGAVGVARGFANVAGLSVRRGLPEALWAGHTHRLELELRCPGARREARDLHVCDGNSGETRGVAAVPPGGAQRVTVGWRPSRRGAVELAPLSLRTSWPHGLVEHTLHFDLPAEVIVWPGARGAAGPPGHEDTGVDHETARSDPHQTGDFVGLRDWRPEDGLRRVHAPTSARRGQPMVAVRQAEGGRSRQVVVRDLHGRAWEAELERAAAAIVRAGRAGEAVGLLAPGLDLPPRAGEAWRRGLLDALATLPERP